MAAPSKPVGYECEFIDQVPEDYFCKQCKHVAREPIIASCCIEVLCKACIKEIIQDKKPCPSCESSDISALGPHKKYQPKILLLKVHCSLKARGCEWTGQLRLLDAHLDLTTGDCVYVDVDCPSKCDQKVQKRNVDTHLAAHCPNRDYTCPHCSFNATFREVSEHFEVCRYYPLVCPNRCGASFERDVLEDHMKMCGLQKVQCEFSYAGCEAEFIRDQQKEHMEQNTQKHLALVAAATLRISQEKDAQLKVLANQQKELEKKLGEQQEEFHKQQRMFEQKLDEKDQQIKTLKEQQKSNDNTLRMQAGVPPYEFTITAIKVHQGARNCFAECLYYMHTHPGGYKFLLRVNPSISLYNGPGLCTDLSLDAFLLKGHHDDNLKFPVKFTIALELLNQHRDEDHHKGKIQCEVKRKLVDTAAISKCGELNAFFPLTALEWNKDNQTQYLKNDCLKFRVTKIKFQ